MLFDRVLAFAKTDCRADVRDSLHRSALFRFTLQDNQTSYNDLVPAGWPDRRIKLDSEEAAGFHLPFPAVVYEFGSSSKDDPGRRLIHLAKLDVPDKLGCLFAVDHGDDVLTFSSGTLHLNLLTATGANAEELGNFKKLHGYLLQGKKVACAFSFISPAESTLVQMTDGRSIEAAAVAEDMQNNSRPVDGQDYLRKLILSDAQALATLGLLATLYINRPTHFVVEEQPARWKDKPPKPLKPGQLANSTRRSHFIVLTPEQIRKKYVPHEITDDEEQEAKIKRRPHHRRGHWRSYQSEKFSEKVRGTRQWIDAIWVGPKEAVQGPNRYIVRLDK